MLVILLWIICVFNCSTILVRALLAVKTYVPLLLTFFDLLHLYFYNLCFHSQTPGNQATLLMV